MYSGHGEPALLQYPVALETAFTPVEIEELRAKFLQPSDESVVVSPKSGSNEGSIQGVRSIDHNSLNEDERKRKRKISNKESARRSRWRKKRHLEDVNALSVRLANKNRDLKNRLGLVVNRCHLVRRQNEQLRSEFVALRTRLSSLVRIFGAMQWEINEPGDGLIKYTVINE